MGLLTFSGSKPTSKDITIAKNYLNETELKKLNNLVSAYFDIAELRAMEHQPMHMCDWIEQLDDLIRAMKSTVLDNPGKVSHEVTMEKAKTEYTKYQQKTRDELSPAEKDFLDNLKQTQKLLQKNTKQNKES